jgi:putative peptidoglycan lipid II flippase
VTNRPDPGAPDGGAQPPAEPPVAESQPAAGGALPAGGSAGVVAAGILLSRTAGLVRGIVFAGYLGTSPAASAFSAAVRMPNVLQNLLGEGTLSASFIPVYSELLERGEKEAAGRLAGAVFALLLAAAGGLALFGVLMAPVLVSFFLPGFEGELRELTIACTRIIFPMTGVLVLSAWALGVLNSHRKFLVSYMAPVIWNAAMIATLLLLGGRLEQNALAVALAWGALAGGALQFLVQVPWILRLERDLRLRWDLKAPGIRTVLSNAGPAILGRGVVQLSGWLDLVLASLLFAGAVASLSYAQLFYLLPVSLFGMSVAAAELPELSRQGGAGGEALRLRVGAGLRQMAVFVVPSVVGYILLGDVILAAVFERGEFGRADTMLVHLVLGGYTIGLLASTATRLYNSAFYALRDTRTPARIAAVRVGIAALLGGTLMVSLEPVTLFGFTLGFGPAVTVMGNPIGVAGLTAGAGIAAWIEWILLRRALARRIGDVTAGAVLLRLFAAATVGAVAGRALLWLLPPMHDILALLVVLVPFGVIYFGLANLFRVEEVNTAVNRVLGRLMGRRRRSGGG